MSRETEEGITHYLYDNNNILQEYDSSTQVYYNYQPQTYGNLISQYRETESSYYHYDGNFSTSALTDSTQTETDTYKYSAWGETVAKTGSTENPFTWKGEIGYVFDESTGLFTLRIRQYQSETGRFISSVACVLTHEFRLISIIRQGAVSCDSLQPLSR